MNEEHYNIIKGILSEALDGGFTFEKPTLIIVDDFIYVAKKNNTDIHVESVDDCILHGDSDVINSLDLDDFPENISDILEKEETEKTVLFDPNNYKNRNNKRG